MSPKITVLRSICCQVCCQSGGPEVHRKPGHDLDREAEIRLLETARINEVARRTRFGRSVYAIGGNTEAARRAGIRVDLIRVEVFVLGSTLAAWGGVLAASRLLAVAQNTGGGPILLNAIAAAVIGGTSLFGGRGSPWAALLGIALIQSISNGMDLLSFDPATKSIVTGLVLILAVSVDAIARRRRTTGQLRHP